MKKRNSTWKKAVGIVFTLIFSITALPTSVVADIYWPEAPSVNTPSVMVMEVNTGAVLYEKNSNEVNYPASITKILTTLLVLEHCELDEVVTFSRDAIDNTPRDSSHIARDYGEEMTVEECLYAIMLESANECAYAAGEHVGVKLGGDYQTFIDLMNQKAESLGCTNTHFANANGLPDTNHWTSAHDMALISAEAYRNETFRIITGSTKYQIPPTNKHDEITYLSNHHQMLHASRTSGYVYQHCTGGKTGYTVAAGSTLVTFAEKDGLSLVCVVMRTDGTSQYNDTRALFEYVFKNFHSVKITEEQMTITEEETNKGVMNFYESYVDLDKDSYVVLPVSADIKEVKNSLVTDGLGSSIIAQIQYTYGDNIVGSVDIVPAEDVKIDNYFDIFSEENRDTNIIKVKPSTVIIMVIALIVIIVGIIYGKHLYDNFYVIIHDMEVRKQRKERFKPISSKKKKWRKRDRMFK